MKHLVTFILKNIETGEKIPVKMKVTIEKSDLFPYGNEMEMVWEYITEDPKLQDEFFDIRYDKRWSPKRETEYIKETIVDKYSWIWKPIYIKVR